jgi:hypothetical protein
MTIEYSQQNRYAKIGSEAWVGRSDARVVFPDVIIAS